MKKTIILSVYLYLLIFCIVNPGLPDLVPARAAEAPGGQEKLVYAVRLIDSYGAEQRDESKVELDYLKSLGIACRIQEDSRSGKEADNRLYILCGQAPTINDLQETVNKVRQNHLNFVIVTVREELVQPGAPAAAEEKAPEPEVAKPPPVQQGDIVYTIRLSNTYDEAQLKLAEEELKSLKALNMDCRLQESTVVPGSAVGKKYSILCGQAQTINGLQETVNQARKNHFNFLITLAPYAPDHGLEAASAEEGAAPVISPEGNKDVAEAFTLLNDGELDKAQVLFLQVVKSDANNTDALYGLALVEVKRKNWAKALATIKPLLSHSDRKDIQATAKMISYNMEMTVGWDLVKTAPNKAMESFLRARKFDKTPETMEGLAYAYYHKGEYDKALPIFEEMFKQTSDGKLAEMIISTMEKMGEKSKLIAFYSSLDPAVRSSMSFNPEKKQNLEMIQQYIETGDYVQAESLLKEMYLLEPGNAQVLSSFGWLYLEKRDPVKAEEYYRSALSRDPYNLQVMQGLAGALMALQRDEEALVYLEKVKEGGVDVAGEMDKANLAIYIRKRQFIQALGIASKMEKSNPNDPAVHLLIANLYMGKEEREKAFAYYTRAYQLDQNNFEVKMQLLRFFLVDGRFDQIKIMLEQFKGYTFTDEELTKLREFYLAYYDQYSSHLLAIEDYNSAKLAALSGLDLAPDDMVFLTRVAWVSLNLQDYQRAAYYFQLALRQQPEQVDLWFGLGLSYLNLGEDEKAEEALSRVENSNDVDLLYRLADVYQQLERYEDALRITDRAGQLSANRVGRGGGRAITPKVTSGLSGTSGSAQPIHGQQRDRLDVFNPFSSGSAAAPVAPIQDVAPVSSEIKSESRFPIRLSPKIAPARKQEPQAEPPELPLEEITPSSSDEAPVLDPAPLPVTQESGTDTFPKKKITRSEPVHRGDIELAANVKKVNRKSADVLSDQKITGLGDADATNSSLAVGEYFRGRSGDSGLGRLTEVAFSVDGLFNWDHYHNLYGYMNHLWLASGTVPPELYSLYGTYPYGAPIHDNIGKIEVVEPGMGYLFDGPNFALRAELGFTPLSGVVEEQMTWQVKFSTNPERRLSGFFLAEEIPVRDSFLAFVGERDLFTDLTWGGVTKQGIRGGLRYDLDRDWEAAFQALYYPNIDGEETITNSETAATLLFAYNLWPENFDYFDIGPLFIYDSYDSNTNFFTYGHGGYFSPERFLLAGIYFDALRFSIDRNAFLRATGNIGYLTYSEETAKKYPFDPSNNEWYAATEDAKIGGDIRLFAGYRLNDHWSVIATSGLQTSKGYSAYFIGGSLIFHFDEHGQIYVTDLKRSNIISRYLLE